MARGYSRDRGSQGGQCPGKCGRALRKAVGSRRGNEADFPGKSGDTLRLLTSAATLRLLVKTDCLDSRAVLERHDQAKSRAPGLMALEAKLPAQQPGAPLHLHQPDAVHGGQPAVRIETPAIVLD